MVHYTDSAGVDLFGQWLDALADVGTRATIAARLVRLELGLFGDSKVLGDGVSELRVDHGPGWRVYYGRQAGRVVLLLAGSDKSGQKASIKNGAQAPGKLESKGHPMTHQEWLAGQLQNDAFAAQYLTQAAQDLEPAVFTTALRHVIDARGGLAKVADEGNLSRQSLYKAFPLSGRGNPTAKTMFAALRASGLHLTFTAA